MPNIPITAASLRSAMREPRYWQPGHPEREAFGRWVTDGWQRLESHGRASADGTIMVQVSAYTRVRNGKEEDVSAYERTQHISSHEQQDREGKARAELAQAPPLLPPSLPFFARPPYHVPPPPRATPRTMERIPNQPGKEAASDVPSWAQGARRMVDETPQDFARRVIDERFGPGASRESQYGRDLQKLQKFGQRAFRNPRTNLLELDDEGA